MTGQQRTEALHASKELSYLERIVSLYLDCAELRAERKIPMSMEDWAKRLGGFLEFNGNELLTGPGKISAEQAKLHAETERNIKLFRIDSTRATSIDSSCWSSRRMMLCRRIDFLLFTAAQNKTLFLLKNSGLQN